MLNSTDTPHKKQIVNLEISEHLANEAKLKGINLSAVVEAYLCRELGENSRPDFCEAYATEVVNRQAETDTLKAYCKEHGQF